MDRRIDVWYRGNMSYRPIGSGEPTVRELAVALAPIVAMLFGVGSFVWLLWSWLT